MLKDLLHVPKLQLWRGFTLQSLGTGQFLGRGQRCWIPSHGNELRVEQGSPQPGSQLELLALPGTNESPPKSLFSFHRAFCFTRFRQMQEKGCNSRGSIKTLAEGFLDVAPPCCLCVFYTKLFFLTHLASSAF